MYVYIYINLTIKSFGIYFGFTDLEDTLAK